MDYLKFFRWDSRTDFEITKNDLYEIKQGSLAYQQKLEDDFDEFLKNDDLLNGLVL